MKLKFTVLLLFLGVASFAQQKYNEELQNLSVEEQFDFVFQKSYTNKQYQSKFVKIGRYNSLKNNTLDTLIFQKNSLIEKSANISKNLEQINQLQQKISSLENQLDGAVKSKDQRFFLGIPLPKGTFSIVLGGFIVLLISLSGFFAYKYYENIASSKKAVNNFKNLQEEYDQHKKTSLKRFQEVNRKLQDELNKQWKKDNKI